MVVAFTIVVAGGNVETSTPGYQLFNDAKPDGYTQFMQGLSEGLSQHKRSSELEQGFGALGSFQQ
jgi:hypothetical protein